MKTTYVTWSFNYTPEKNMLISIFDDCDIQVYIVREYSYRLTTTIQYFSILISIEYILQFGIFRGRCMVFILVGSREYCLEQDKTKNEVTQSCRSLWHNWCFGCSNQLEGHYWISKETERAVWCKLIFVISNISKTTIIVIYF